MELICDYQEWCRLCGSLDGIHETQTNLQIIEDTLKIPTENIRVCNICSSTLSAMNELVTRARRLVRMFNGLAEENESDLSLKRLNAYRAHFNLSAIEFELELVQSEEKNDYQPLEYVEEYQVAESNSKMEEIEEIVEEHVQSPYSQDQDEHLYLVDSESYIEEELIDETLEEPQTHQLILPKSVPLSQKTDEEKFFTFACHFCDHPEFLNMKSLAAHCKTEHNTTPQVHCCSDKCDAVLSTWRRLLIHKEQHFPSDEKLKCPQCQRQYVTQAKLDLHMKKHSFCFICNDCGKSFKEEKTMRTHREIHQKSIEERRNHICPYDPCGLRFISMQACKNHMAMKHQQIVTSQCTEPNCGKTFFTRKAYQEHLKNTHSERRFACDQCNFKGKTKSALNVHRDSHTTGNKFFCDICNASFPVLRRLKGHMVCHSNVFIPCPYCKASFKRQKDLKSHINIHTKERLFSCQFCTKSFTNAANARKHKLREHEAELAAWEAENGVGGRKKFKCYE